MTTDAVRDARAAIFRVDVERQLAAQQVRGATNDRDLYAALGVFEAAIRSEERQRYVALVEVAEAMDRAWARFGDGSMRGSQMTRTERFAVLAEEIGEVATEVVKEQRNRSQEPGKHGPFDAAALIAELVDVAAAASNWAMYERSLTASAPEGEADAPHIPILGKEALL